MSVLLDIVSSAIIVGLIVLLVLNIQSTMVESNVENRILQELQGIASVTVDLIQEDIKNLVEFKELSDTTIKIKNTDGEILIFERVDKSLRLYREFPDGSEPVERLENVFLQSLHFETLNLPGASHALLRIRVTCEIENVMNESGNLLAAAQRDVLLRNLYLPQKN